jgi:hypothetical protein
MDKKPEIDKSMKLAVNEAEELTRFIMDAKPTPKGHVSKEDLLESLPKEKVKAVLFIPEDSSVKDLLDIEVVGLNPASLGAMVARRC